MKRDRAGFEERLRNLCELVAADLVGLDAERTMAALSERLRAARTAQTRYEGRNRQLDDAVAATRMAVDASTAAAYDRLDLAESIDAERGKTRPGTASASSCGSARRKADPAPSRPVPLREPRPVFCWSASVARTASTSTPSINLAIPTQCSQRKTPKSKRLLNVGFRFSSAPDEELDEASGCILILALFCFGLAPFATSVFDPGFVKTPTGRECAAVFSILPQTGVSDFQGYFLLSRDRLQTVQIR